MVLVVLIQVWIEVHLQHKFYVIDKTYMYTYTLNADFDQPFGRKRNVNKSKN